jgi:membrane-bound lytic murein transglycosylase C
MKRRQLLTAASLLPFAQWAIASEFTDFMDAQEAGAKSLDTEFETYQVAYLKEFESYKKDIEKEWDEARTSSPSTWVSYQDANKSRTTLDYRKNTIEVAIRTDDNPTPEKIANRISEAITKPASEAIKQDPILHKVHKQPISIADTLMSGIALTKEAITDLIDKARMLVDQDSKGEYVKVTVTLPEKAKTDRVRQFLPAVQRYSKEFKVDIPLVLAVIHTESAFNPLAQSHVPAFGLMQIVPNSAGKDVQKLIYKRNQAPSSSMLFKPDINIQHGCAYLHILNYRYLKSIKNKAAREHCCIAAYNTGAGNVARAFTGKTNVNSAAKIINRMSSDEVYLHLRKNLKYKEARDYIKRVNKHKSLYT